MDDFVERRIAKIDKMGFKELNQYPMFVANRKKIFDEALNLALNKKPSNKLEPKTIELRVHYVTNFGQEVCMIGSINKLGSWDARGSAVKMKWNNGHLWTQQFQVSELENLCEYKFVIKEGENLIRWEEGHNHIYDYKKLLQRMKQPEILKQIEQGNFDEIEVATDRDKIAYNIKTKVFSIHTLWQA